MELRLKSVTALFLSISLCALCSGSSAGDANAGPEIRSDSQRASDPTSTSPLARFFSINAVLKETDRQRGRGPGAIRLAALTPSNIATDAPPALQNAPASGDEPFGLVTFRVPDGMLWRKWQRVEAEMARDQIILARCRAEPESCPPHAARFLR